MAGDNAEALSRMKAAREHEYKESIEEVRKNITSTQAKLNEINQMPGASAWLSALPLKEHDFWLTKREFWDSIRLRYDWPLTNTPANCACGAVFSVAHALSCKLGGFVTLRHNELRDLTAELLAEVCHDVQIEPKLEPLTGESFSNRTANTHDESRLDVSARGLWVPYQKAFMDIRVFNPLAKRYSSVAQAFDNNEKEKKRAYSQRVREIENGTFSPLVFSINGGLSKECSVVYKRIAQMLTDKRVNSRYSDCITFIRTRISFALTRSALRCIRGSRKWRNQRPAVKDEDIPYVVEACGENS